MTKFKVGDKVRILDASKIEFGSQYWRDGDVTEISQVDAKCHPYLKTRTNDSHGLYIATNEFSYIELVTPKKSKKQRLAIAESHITDAESEIATSKSQVAELTAEVETLKKAEKPKYTLEGLLSQISSANEQRKAIIAEAKAFVEATLKEIDQQDGWGTTDIPLYSDCGRLHVNFHVNDKKRTVTALAYLGNLYPHGDREIFGNGIAKCAPDDVFNADIGKAIALGRALGLDVSKFEQAVKPTEVVVGQVTVGKHGTYFGKVTAIKGERAYTEKGSWWALTSSGYIITDDTDAQY